MKCKPIPEGFKFCARTMYCAQSGWCFFIVPDGSREKIRKESQNL